MGLRVDASAGSAELSQALARESGLTVAGGALSTGGAKKRESSEKLQPIACQRLKRLACRVYHGELSSFRDLTSKLLPRTKYHTGGI